MAATITFRPKPEVRAALDQHIAALGGDRSKHINAALAEYLGLDGAGDVDDPPIDEVEPVTPPRRARQAVPTPAGEAPSCPHPKSAIKKFSYGKQCTDCGRML